MPARSAPRARRRRPPAVAAAAAVAAALLAAGCASATRAFVRPYVTAPSGLEVPEQRLRDALAGGRWDAALRQAGRERDGGPSDALLRELYRGTAAYYGGRWPESALAFDRAARMADDRYTKRVSRGALALATNDRALPYVPGDNERLLAHYYAALGYLHAHDLNGAAVEARRLAYRLQQADARRDPLDRSTRAALRYFTGAVFEAAGDREDAEVAYRNAAALGAAVDDAAARRAEADSALRGTLRGARRRGGAALAAAAPAGPASGEVVVLVEGGFVAHRVNERLSVRLGDDAADRLTVTSGGVVVAGHGAATTGAWDPAPGTLGGRLAALLTGDQALWAGDPPPTLALDAPDSASHRGAAGRGGADEGGVDRGAPDTVGVPARGVGGVRGVGGGEDGQVVFASQPGPPTSGPPAGAPPTGRAPFPRGGSGGGGWKRDDRSAGWGRTFTIAWPAYRRPAGWGRGVGVVVAPSAAPAVAATPAALPAAPGVAVVPAVVRGDLSLAAAGDFKRDRGKVLARLVTRAALRASLAREAGRRHRGLDDVVRFVSNAAEQADTRSWHLLPGELQVARLRLPAGAHALAVEVGGRRVPLGTVRVAPGAVRFVSARVWDPAATRVTAFGTEGGPAPARPGGAL
jgi:hypothetical protein